MIPVETLPVRMTAVQWHQPGDSPELVIPYRLGTEERFGVHSAGGMQRVLPGSWIVFDQATAVVYGAAEFHKKFRIVEEEENPS